MDDVAKIKVEQLDRLVELENSIKAGMELMESTGRQVGQALMTVRDDKLYGFAGFETFAEYCDKRWGIGRNYAHKLMKAEETHRRLCTAVHTEQVPEKERHLREIAQAPEEIQPDIVERGQEIAAIAEREPTAEDYKQARVELLEGEDPAAEWKVERKKAQKYAEALQRAVDYLHRIRPDGSKHAALLRHCQQIIMGLDSWK